VPLVIDGAPGAGYPALLPLIQESGALSTEAATVRHLATEAMESGEISIALFGPKSEAIMDIWSLFDESRGKQAEQIEPMSLRTVNLAMDFIRALPDDVPLPELAIEPDGSIEMDWIRSRSTIFSLSVGEGQRLAYAWVDGAERGHAVVFFDRASVPWRILQDLKRIQ